MTAEWNAERVLSLAPDASSAKAGQGLGATRSWSHLGTADGLVWGECQGSGAKPYQTKVDLGGPAFSCSCPSRKFPCKHGLGLMLIWANGPAPFAAEEPPPWVASWKESREQKVEKTREKQEEKARAPVDLTARAKREAARFNKVAAGLDDLSLWISDLVRQGFTSLHSKPAGIWDEQARRMVDAQAPGVARRLRQIDTMTLSGAGWQSALLDRLARIHLLAEGFRRLESVPADVAEDVRSTIGFPNDLDAIRAGPGVRDHWQVIGQSSSLEDRLTVYRTWLIGRATGRPALLLDFAVGNRPPEGLLAAGLVLDAELAFFPSAFPLRALLKGPGDTASAGAAEAEALPPLAKGGSGGVNGGRSSQPGTLSTPLDPPFSRGEGIHRPSEGLPIESAFASFGEALSRNPWIELIPVILPGVWLRQVDDSWSVVDDSGAVLPLSKRFARGWQLLAVSGGGPITIAGEFDGSTLEALSAQAGGQFFSLSPSGSGSQSEPRTDWPSSAPPALPSLAEVTASAVVGLDRKPPVLPADDPVRKALNGIDERDPPARLLAIAAASSLYGRVGRKPMTDASPLPESCPSEDLPPPPDRASARLRRILTGEQFAVLMEWLGLLAKSGAGGRLPDDTLATALEMARKRPEFRPAIQQVLGERGRWLAARNPSWKDLGVEMKPTDADLVWQTGSKAERQASLSALRSSDPGRARELLGSTWTKESADDRALFLEALESNLGPEDEPFLESALDDRSKAVRKAASRLLAKLPGSALAARALERALPWMIGPGGTLQIQPPESCTSAMTRDGIEPKSPVGVGQKAWWFRQGLGMVPPSTWSAFLDQRPEDLIAKLEGSEWKEDVIGGWAEATLLHRDAEWAWALLQARSNFTHSKQSSLLHDQTDAQLFDVLPESRREQFVLRTLPETLYLSHPVHALLQRCQFPWSEMFGHSVLQALKFGVVDAIEKGVPYHILEHNPLFGSRLPVSLLEDAETDWVNGHLTPKNPALAESSWKPLIETLRFRRAMHEEFAS